MDIYYVYAYLRKTDNTPYYIGKGKNSRAYVKHKGLTVPKNISKIVILENNLTEIGALALERRMIRWYGRKDIHTGVLLNRTEGGDGVSGLKHSEKTRKQISLSSSGCNNPNFGKPRSEEFKEKLRSKLKGKPLSEETRKKMSEAAKVRKINGMQGKRHTEETKKKISLNKTKV
jgi:hypothetical protein